MKSKSQSLKRKFRSLAFRLPAVFVFSYIVLMVIVMLLVYFHFRSRMMNEYTRMAEGITNLMAHELDPSKTVEYMDKNFRMKEYNRILDRYYDLMYNYPDVLYMYVYIIDEEGEHVVFDLDSELGGEADPPGTLREIDPSEQKYREDLIAGREIPAVAGDTADGYLLSYARPVYDGQGKCQCYACVDFSMDYLKHQDMVFLMELFWILLLANGVILVIDIFLIRKNVVGPLTKMAACTSEFAYETEADRFHNIQIMEELNIRTNDEIEDVYNVFLSDLKEGVYYLTNLSRAKITIHDTEEKLDRVSQKAYVDALTGVGNKTAYNKEVKALTLDIVNGRGKFAIVMVDINNLKYVNDTFGHKAGDEYIKGSCSMICGMFPNAPVFRMGGDEFVVVLKKENYDDRQLRFEQLLTAFLATYQQPEKEAWERYSASAGMSEFVPGEDKTVDQVLKRADDAMYEYKMKFKQKYGSYR